MARGCIARTYTPHFENGCGCRQSVRKNGRMKRQPGHALITSRNAFERANQFEETGAAFPGYRLPQWDNVP